MKIPALIAFATPMFWAIEAQAQTRFGIELSVGQGAGSTSYIQNVTYLEDDQLFLADEVAGSGLNLNLAFVFTDLELSVDAVLFDRSKLELHHQSDQTGVPEDRIRPDGSVDDAGYTYSPISPTTIVVPDRSRGSLLVTTVTGGWRYFILQGDIDIWVPLAAGLAITHVAEATRPWAFGAVGSAGLGFTFDIANPIALSAQARINAMITPTYGPQNDAARTSAQVNESTLSAAVSTMLYSTFGIGIQVAIR